MRDNNVLGSMRSSIFDLNMCFSRELLVYYREYSTYQELCQRSAIQRSCITLHKIQATYPLAEVKIISRPNWTFLIEPRNV